MTRSHDSIRVFHVIPSLVCFIASVSACANGIKHLKGIDAAPRLQGNARPRKQTREKKIQQLHLCHGIANICKHAVATMQWYAVIVTLHPWNCLWCYLVLNIQSFNLTVLNLEAIRGYAHCLPFRNSEFHQKKGFNSMCFQARCWSIFLAGSLGRFSSSSRGLLSLVSFFFCCFGGSSW